MAFVAKNPGEVRAHDTIWSVPLDVDQFGSNATSGAATIERLSSSVAGKDCVHIIHNNLTAGTISSSKKIITTSMQSLSKIAGSEVTIRFMMKGNAIGSGWNPYLLIKGSSVIFGANPVYYNSTVVLDASLTGTYDWVEVNYTFEPNSDFVPEYFAFGVSAAANTSGECWIAGVRITTMSPLDSNRPAPDNSYVQPITGYRGFQINPNPTRKDFFDLKSTYNANLVRFQFNTWSTSDNPILNDKTNMAEWDAWLAAKLNTFANARLWAKQNDIKIIVSLMVFPGGPDTYCVSQMQYNSQWYMKYLEFWKTLTTICINDPTIIAFDVHNEPAYGFRLRPQGPSTSFRTVIKAAIKEIRKIDPSRTVIVEPIHYADPGQYRYMKPYEFENVWYSFHMYRPNEFTTSSNTTLTYPGFTINSGVNKAIGWVEKVGGHIVDKEFIRDIMKPVRDFQLAYRVPIFLGEFSSPRWTPGCAQFLADISSIADEYNWITTYHAFREANSWDVEYEALPANQGGGILASGTTDRKQALLNWLAPNVSKYLANEQIPIAPSVSYIETWNDTLTLSWIPGSCSIGSWLVEYKETSSQTWTSQPVSRELTSYQVTGLVPGVSYDFKVTLISQYGNATSTTLVVTKTLSYVLSNIVATPSRAYSIRQTRSTYTGPLMRIRRSSDNAEQDIGAFTSGPNMGYIDTSAISSFVGSNSAYLVKWYDQSVNAFDLIQPTPTRQPRIVNAGVIDVVNALTSPSFALANTQYMVDPHSGLYNAGSATMIGVVRNNASAADTYIACESSSTVATQFYALVSGSAKPDDAKLSIRDDAGSSFVGNGGSTAVNGFLSGTLRQFVVNDTGSTVRVASNISAETQDTTYTRAAHTVTLNQFALGCRLRAASADKYANMNLSELICFNSSISDADKLLIKNNQVKAYSLV